MSPLRIVEAFDVIKDISPCFITRPVVAAADPIVFHPREEAFHHGVVVTLPRTAHAAFDAVVREEPLELLCRILGGFNRSSQHSITWRSCDGNTENVDDQIEQGVHRCHRQVAPRLGGVSIDSDSGKLLPRGYLARRQR